MKLVRRHPLFFTLVAIILVAIAVEAWLVFSLQKQERVLETQLTQKIAEIERLLRQRPGPTDENLRRAREDFAQNVEVLTTMLRSLNVSGPDELEYFKGEPAGPTEAYFEIGQFMEAMSAAGKKAGVLLRPDEHFGFTAYINEGPEAELIRPVHRQRRIIEYLLSSALFPAGPRTLESVQREDPRMIVRSQEKTAGAASAAQPPAPAARKSGLAGGTSAQSEASAASDFFSIDPQISARTPGYVDTMAFRIVFTGQTSSLRGFMNALAVPEIPLVVRSVEVEQLRAESSSASSGRITTRLAEGQTAPADLAIVSDNESRFIVTVELFEVRLQAPEVPGSTPKQ